MKLARCLFSLGTLCALGMWYAGVVAVGLVLNTVNGELENQ